MTRLSADDGRWRGPDSSISLSAGLLMEQAARVDEVAVDVDADRPACRLKLHKLPKATSDYSAQHTASLVEKYMGRFQLPFAASTSNNAKYPPSRNDEYKIMLENEQWKNSVETAGGHSTPLTSQSPSVARRNRAW